MNNVSVLGTLYSVHRVDSGEDEFIEKMQYGGYCDAVSKEIVILNLKTTDEWKNETAEAIQRKECETLRHEIIHAFLNESGLQWDSASADHWAKNEEMVDWFAIQFPKLIEAFKAAGAL